MTQTTALLATGLTQGGSASPALFRIFIDDLASALRMALGKPAMATSDSFQDKAKLVADDVIIVAQNEIELQLLLDTCTTWAATNHLEWKPQKCSIEAKHSSTSPNRVYTLAGLPVPIREHAKYLGVTTTTTGFRKDHYVVGRN